MVNDVNCNLQFFNEDILVNDVNCKLQFAMRTYFLSNLFILSEYMIYFMATSLFVTTYFNLGTFRVKILFNNTHQLDTLHTHIHLTKTQSPDMFRASLAHPQ
jgi:hypothetical protein